MKKRSISAGENSISEISIAKLGLNARIIDIILYNVDQLA